MFSDMLSSPTANMDYFLERDGVPCFISLGQVPLKKKKLSYDSLSSAIHKWLIKFVVCAGLSRSVC